MTDCKRDSPNHSQNSCGEDTDRRHSKHSFSQCEGHHCETSAGRQHYLTAISKVDDQLVEIIDVEKVLAEIVPYNAKVSREKLDDPVLSAPVAVRCCWSMTPM